MVVGVELLDFMNGNNIFSRIPLRSNYSTFVLDIVEDYVSLASPDDQVLLLKWLMVIVKFMYVVATYIERSSGAFTTRYFLNSGLLFFAALPPLHPLVIFFEVDG